MKILLVNEEGCFAPGIIALAKSLSLRHRVCIVAPLSPQPGVGHQITISRPLRTRQYFVLSKIKLYSVDGTPVDCVTLALDKILKSKPDVIISGICNYNNRGETIYSSGVVSAAIAGTIQGIPSIALSAKINDTSDEKFFYGVANHFAKNLNFLVKNIVPGITLNVNYPEKLASKKIVCTNLTHGMISNRYFHEVNPFGLTYYWLRSPVMGYNLESLQQKGDLYWIKKNFITVTPLKLDLTCESAMEILENGKIGL